jgi:hypothetical protein
MFHAVGFIAVPHGQRLPAAAVTTFRGATGTKPRNVLDRGSWPRGAVPPASGLACPDGDLPGSHRRDRVPGGEKLAWVHSASAGGYSLITVHAKRGTPPGPAIVPGIAVHDAWAPMTRTRPWPGTVVQVACIWPGCSDGCTNSNGRDYGDTSHREQRTEKLPVALANRLPDTPARPSPQPPAAP